MTFLPASLRRRALVLLALALAGCAGIGSAPTATSGKPKLVVLFVVDGLPLRQV